MHRFRALALTLFLTLPAAASAAEVVWLDGRHETVKRVVVKDDHVLVSFERGMRRVPIRQVVRVLDDGGKDAELSRALRDGPLGAEDRAALDSLESAPPERLGIVQGKLADTMSRAVLEELVGLAASKKSETRLRAAETLLLMGLKESLRAGLDVLFAEKDSKQRLRLASALLGVAGAVGVTGTTDRVAEGLEDKNGEVRTCFALVLARIPDERAAPVLRDSGLKSRDHHFRESAAEALADLGDDSGVKVLIGMLTRTKHPGGPEIMLAEKIRVCGHLGRLKAKKARSALEKAARSKEPALAAAAKDALRALPDQSR